MEKVRGRLKEFRYRFEQKIDHIPSCFKPKKDMPKIVYTVRDSRECEALLCQNYSAGEFRLDQEILSLRERERLRRAGVIYWKEVDVSDQHHQHQSCDFRDHGWNPENEKEGLTIRLATFDVALFSMAPAIPPDHPAAIAPTIPELSTPSTDYLSSESSIFSCKSKSTSSEASSGMTFFSNSRESNDSAEACAILSHTPKPTPSLNLLHPCSLLRPVKAGPVKLGSFDIRKAWRTSSLSAKTRAICHFRPGGGRNDIHGPLYHSKLNPVFSLNASSTRSSKLESLPRSDDEFSSEGGTISPAPLGFGSTEADDASSSLCYTPVGSPDKEKLISGFSSPTQSILSDLTSSDERSPETRRLLKPVDVGNSPSIVSSPAEHYSSAASDFNLVSARSSSLNSTMASPCDTDVFLRTDGAESAAPASESKERHPLSVLDILLEVDADIIALQEVRAEEERGMKPLSELAEALGMEYAFAESWAPDFGNAVLSRWPIKSASVQQIHDETDYRNVLKVVVSVPLAGDLHFYCTQLDHLDEDWRMKQIDSLTSMVPPNQPHVIAGNLNALNQADYSKVRWEEIAESRKKNNKVPPRGDVMKRLLQEKRYTDAKKFSAPSTSAVKVPQETQETEATCYHGTRVDYILGSHKLPFDFISGSYSVVPSRGTSNHDLVMVDLRPHFHP
ncbi:hypothetical protein R1sor_005160 [Riccia sorocarpa]|uniref:Endonuclease/exonuclease/phosphatase domain-containing protein n=1 Tax=Riccia sorocarpa TaxID=122646 RepID=A0ABD3HMI2_9MARC